MNMDNQQVNMTRFIWLAKRGVLIMKRVLWLA